RRTSAGRPSWMPWRRTGSASSSSARIGVTTGASCPSALGENESTAVEPLLADERDEAAGNGADHRRPRRAADDHLEPLGTPPADGNDEPAARLELLVEELRQLGRGGRNGDRAERRALGDAPRPVADVDAHAVVPGGGKVAPGPLGELGNPLDRGDLGRPP